MGDRQHQYRRRRGQGQRLYGHAVVLREMSYGRRIQFAGRSHESVRGKHPGGEYGPEFTSKGPDQWAYGNQVVLDFSRPGKPTDNAFIESFNGSVRTECLNENWFLSLGDGKEKIESWRRDYNEHRPHSNLASREFASSGQTSLAR